MDVYRASRRIPIFMLREAETYLLRTNISIMTCRVDTCFLHPRHGSLFITLLEEDAYFSCPKRQMFISSSLKAGAYLSCSPKRVPISYTFWDRCLFNMPNEADSYLLCSIWWIFVMSVRWMYVPSPTSTHPLPLVDEELVSFTCILYIHHFTYTCTLRDVEPFLFFLLHFLQLHHERIGIPSLIQSFIPLIPIG